MLFKRLIIQQKSAAYKQEVKFVWLESKVKQGRAVQALMTKYNGTASFKNFKNYLNTNIYSYLETSGGQSSNLYLNVVHFFNTSVN